MEAGVFRSRDTWHGDQRMGSIASARVESEETVASHTPILTLNCPSTGNALSDALVVAQLAGIYEEPDTGGKLIALKGADWHFCVGFDLSGIGVQIGRFLQSIDGLGIPTVAFAKGWPFGAGVNVFVARDFWSCTADATFVFPERALGLVLGNRRLAERVGCDCATALLSTRRAVTAAEAARIGLATTIVADDPIATTIEGLVATGSILDVPTLGNIGRTTVVPAAETDLVRLVRSAARPGLKDRLLRYAGLRRR